MLLMVSLAALGLFGGSGGGSARTPHFTGSVTIAATSDALEQTASFSILIS
jgi:hypothetical protein